MPAGLDGNPNPDTSEARDALLDALVADLDSRRAAGVLLVAVDGIDGAGKTAFADQLGSKMKAGYRALAAMDGHLAVRDWLVGGGMTIADIALYAYTHVADEGGFDLGTYAAVQGWLDRVAAERGHVPIEA